jgi:hypothetical protein
VAHGAASEHPDLLADPNRNGLGKGTGYWVTHHTNKEDALQDPKARAVDDVDWNKIALATGDPGWRAENISRSSKSSKK